jgi:hypothetical protein
MNSEQISTTNNLNEDNTSSQASALSNSSLSLTNPPNTMPITQPYSNEQSTESSEMSKNIRENQTETAPMSETNKLSNNQPNTELNSVCDTSVMSTNSEMDNN